ncbi:MAG: sterol desaturase family protein [Pelagimonas sp.]|jgi:hypothetical protein|nr:sterol desaturase family protein [Pelagimonas sp.]
MNDEAREKFRARYRAAISPRYSGYLHVAVVLLGAGGLIGWGISQLVDFHWTQLWFVVLTYCIYNWGEWASHRYWGHEKTKLFKFFYQRHTGDHHTFFVEHDMEYQMVLDWRVVVFPIALLVATAVGLATPAGIVAYFVLGWNYGWLAFVTVMSCYLTYEVLHFSYHLQKGSVTERIFKLIPGWTYLRLFHTVHHNRHLMAEGNFNITLPLCDWIFGTLYFSSEDWARAKGIKPVAPAE